MAEKYGTVPPKWTKEWWAYFWDYYKWHTVITVGVIICVAFTVVQCATKEKYDLTVTYAGHMIYSDGEIERFTDALEPYIDDADGSGEKAIFFQQLNFMDTQGSEEYDYASQSKLDLEFQNECSFLFLYDKAELEIMLGRESVSNLYMPVSEWAQDMSDEELLYSRDGVPFAVKLDGSAFLAENEIYCEDLYVTVRKNYRDDEKNASAHESSIKIANILIK